MVIPPKYMVSKVVETIKKNTNRSLCRKFVFLKKVYWDIKGLWGKGYFVSTVGINEEVIRRYVQSQEDGRDTELGGDPELGGNTGMTESDLGGNDTGMSISDLENDTEITNGQMDNE